MTVLVSPPSDAGVDDGPAIAELHRLHAVQREAFLANPYPDAETRQGHLMALAGMLLSRREQIRVAMSADFGAHPGLFTDLVEVLGVAGRAAFAAEQLSTWMAEDQRHTDPALYGTARAGIRYQPKGVIGNIVPWNFPFDLSVGPLVEMLAAGNRVIIKPSDYTPACAQLLREMISKTFPEDLVAVSVGGLTLAKAFPTLRLDHLLYTGSPAVGRQVALAAAQNLVPVTLELGGKCPAILTAGSVDADAVRSVVGTKLIKNGQMCISVDYALVPRADVEAFVAHAQRYLADELPDYASSANCTGIITERHRERIVDLVDEARASGARVISLGGEGDPATRRLPLTLVVDPPGDLRIMAEEIFGPVLPVVGYDDLDDAIAEINAGERPLGLYVFAKDAAVAEYVLRTTTSGGACVNVCAVQGALPSSAGLAPPRLIRRTMSVLDRFRLDDKVAIVTGASSGLGVAFAQALAEAGADLALGARRADRLAETSALVEKTGRRAIAVATDVTRPEDCQGLVAAAMAEFGRVDILVNNAGVGAAVPASRETPDQFRGVIDVNLHGCYWMAQAAGSVMQPGSSIINISSVLGITTAGLPQAAYAASKAGLIGLTRDLAAQWTGRKGIRVNALAPGFFASKMTEAYSEEYVAATLPRVLAGRFGEPEELAAAVIFLASSAGGYVTGQVLTVDGGVTIT